MRRSAALITVIGLLAVALVAAGCGNGTKTVASTSASGQVTTRTVPDVKFAKTKFVLHTGLAIGAFKKWIYDPYRAGTFKKGSSGRTRALVKAALAGAFTANELKNARNAALSDDRLRGLGDRMTALIGKVQGLVPGLRSGNLNVASIASLAAGLGGVTALAKTLGVNVKSLSPPALGG